jgi:hypothetical protein
LSAAPADFHRLATIDVAHHAILFDAQHKLAGMSSLSFSITHAPVTALIFQVACLPIGVRSTAFSLGSFLAVWTIR